MTEQKDAREIAISYKKEFEKDLEICIEAMEANPDDLELRRTHKKLTKIVDYSAERPSPSGRVADEALKRASAGSFVKRGLRAKRSIR
jgi:hypothetical protein